MPISASPVVRWRGWGAGSGPNRLAALLPWLERDYLALDEAFTRLWPDIEAHLDVPFDPNDTGSVDAQPQAADRIAGRH